jgi:hypothetical protein
MKPASALLTTLCVVFLIVTTRVFLSLQLGHDVSISFFGEGPSDPAWIRTAWLAAAMIIGIVLGHLHSRLNSLPQNARIHIGSELRRAVTTGAFWRSLVASPLVFGITYWIGRSQPDPVIAAVLALENGFFCDVLLKRREREITVG